MTQPEFQILLEKIGEFQKLCKKLARKMQKEVEKNEMALAVNEKLIRNEMRLIREERVRKIREAKK